MALRLSLPCAITQNSHRAQPPRKRPERLVKAPDSETGSQRPREGTYVTQRELLHSQPGAGLQCLCTQWHRTSDVGPVLRSLTHQLHPKKMLLRNKKKKGEQQHSEGAEILEQVVSYFFKTSWEVTCNMMFFYKTKQKNPKPLVTTKIKQKPAAACEEGSEERAGNP